MLSSKVELKDHPLKTKEISDGYFSDTVAHWITHNGVEYAQMHKKSEICIACILLERGEISEQG